MHRFQIYDSSGRLLHSSQFLYPSEGQARITASQWIMSMGDDTATYDVNHL